MSCGLNRRLLPILEGLDGTDVSRLSERTDHIIINITVALLFTLACGSGICGSCSLYIADLV